MQKYLGFEVISIQSETNLVHCSLVTNTFRQSILVIHNCTKT